MARSFLPFLFATLFNFGLIAQICVNFDDLALESEFGNTQLEWLRKYLPFSNGVPSHDTLGRVFEQLDSMTQLVISPPFI